ncbi:Esa1p-associated factor [Polyrhizophydium stewartii]|uniref:Chromatin modification-related protein EAF3 n=1 Tax=Polyrhizophydium stewartii TaxID=2732419 RepID=A0ABR4N1M0_9FUNG|nr:Esa1p-associated factor [Polyrhizophydium stewartii]
MQEGDPPFNYEEGETVLCFHGPLIYEAKVLETEFYRNEKDFADGPHYLVHYKGWKSSWDEWVPESRLLKNNDEGLKKQQELRIALKAKRNQKAQRGAGGSDVGSSSASASNVGSALSQAKKRRRDSLAEKVQFGSDGEDMVLRRPEIKITIPDALKTRLVDDWEMLVPLPRDITVSAVLDSFRTLIVQALKKKSVKESRLEESVSEVVEGLRSYFDRALGNILLYRFERQQYDDIRKQFPDRPASSIYGPEHLLRLFVQLPSLVSHTNMDQDAVNILKDHFEQVLTYLHKNQAHLFLKDYEPAPPSYIAQQKA